MSVFMRNLGSVSVLSVLIILMLLSACGLPHSAQGQSLESVLMPMVDGHHGVVSVALRHLPSGESVLLNADAPMPTASLIKLPVLMAVMQAVETGQLSLDQTVVLREQDKVPGSGILTSHFSPGVQMPLRDVLRLMMVYSDNTATNLAVDLIGLPRTSEYMEELGLPQTKLHAKVYRGDTSIFPERSKKFGLGSTTAREMLTLLEKIDRGSIVSQQACQFTVELMRACEDKTMLVRDLPDSAKVAHKSGAVSNSRTDAGFIDGPNGRIAICILTTDNADKSWSNDNAAQVLIGRIARASYDFFNPPTSIDGSLPVHLSVGSSGELVESLQRTLNARLGSAINLSADGDFGPLTEQAVKVFQRSNNLPETGIVDRATWSALGTLVTQDVSADDPEVINANQPQRNPQPPSDSPPIVTCKAWAIGEAKTGNLLWSSNPELRVHPASTTKIMTGFLVTCLAERDPNVLDEIVTISPTADATIGSTCELKAGEQVSVGELLYGLLLPSGNDASVALAEHFGSRAMEVIEAAPAADETTEQPSTATERLAAFVSAMNAMARQLGLEETSYTNTHGLTDPGHLASARDLLTLSSIAMQKSEFRLRVGTKRRGCSVNSQSGYRRNVVWENTNRLLNYEGFTGVKTGTTNAAGCCLVACGEQNGHELIVVILGSTSTESRYADAHNLFRWAWSQLQPSTAADPLSEKLGN